MEEYKLTKEMIDKICMMMRVCDFFNDHPAELEKVPGMKSEVEKFRSITQEVWQQLSEEQRDALLEEHKRQKAFIAQQEAAKAKKVQNRSKANKKK